MSLKFPFAILVAFIFAIANAQALSVTGSLDGSYEGIADTNQNPITTGILRLGWFSVGVTDAQIQSLVNSRDFVTLDSLFHEVAVTTDLNTCGAGLPFQNFTFVEDGDVAVLASWQNPTTGAAGKQAFVWFMDIAETPTQMALLTSSFLFPTALDTLNFTDFGGTFSLDSSAPGIRAIIGNFAEVFAGSGVDLNGGSPLDAHGLYDADHVLQTLAIPEPTCGICVLIGTALLVWQRRVKLL